MRSTQAEYFSVGTLQQIAVNVSSRSFLLSTFVPLLPEVFQRYQERHVWYKLTLYRKEEWYKEKWKKWKGEQREMEKVERRKVRGDTFCAICCIFTTHGRRRLQGFLPRLDEFYFTTAEKKLLENCRCIVPNFNNDYLMPDVSQ